VAHDVDLLDALGLAERVDRLGRDLRVGLLPLQVAALSEAGHVEQDGVELFGEDREVAGEVRPGGDAGAGAVEEQHGHRVLGLGDAVLAGLVVVQLEAAGCDGLAGGLEVEGAHGPRILEHVLGDGRIPRAVHALRPAARGPARARKMESAARGVPETSPRGDVEDSTRERSGDKYVTIMIRVTSLTCQPGAYPQRRTRTQLDACFDVRRRGDPEAFRARITP